MTSSSNETLTPERSVFLGMGNDSQTNREPARIGSEPENNIIFVIGARSCDFV
jgi:hypothetical protein